MITVLLIQDEPQILNDLSTILEFNNFRTLTAPDGVRGLELATKHNPDIVITDYRMPGMFGWEVAYHLLPTSNFSIPIILISASHPMVGIKDYLPLFDDFLQMPFDMEQFINVIHWHTSHNHRLS